MSSKKLFGFARRPFVFALTFALRAANRQSHFARNQNRNCAAKLNCEAAKIESKVCKRKTKRISRSPRRRYFCYILAHCLDNAMPQNP